HYYASQFTYGNPVFIALLGGFFINILFATLRRWPFKTHHIPFIITHIGLLMILAGTLAKNIFGVQGTMSLTEGSSSHRIFFPDSFEVHVEKINPGEPSQILKANYPIQRTFLGRFRPNLQQHETFPELQIHLVDFSPHSMEKLEAWVKHHAVFIKGIPPFPIH